MTFRDSSANSNDLANKPEKSTGIDFISPSSEESPGLSQLHVVRRDGEFLKSEDLQDKIKGFDPSRMKARAILNAEEEKRLIRRVDWHLLPLLAVMYMVKTIDASNVRHVPPQGG